MAVVPASIPVSTTRVNSSYLNWSGTATVNVASGTTTLNQNLDMNASGGSYPNASLVLSGQAVDGSQTRYNSGVILRTGSTTSLIPVLVQVSAPPGRTLPTPLTITVNLTYGAGGGSE